MENDSPSDSLLSTDVCCDVLRRCWAGRLQFARSITRDKTAKVDHVETFMVVFSSSRRGLCVLDILARE